ncbi:MAG: YeeE/YedE family protein [Betaproteobacteria bacterium]|nr:YeeE/YedE family protein [Gammaproteobacteria bacterium]MDH3438143.1 YeeE/YedE family protein [Betaproteobacteria bacterium]
MDPAIHIQVLGAIFVIAVILGAVTNKTNFCAMGAVSDWVNIGDTGRMRAWVFAMAVALAGVAALEGAGVIDLSGGTFPPYRTANFAWIRYLVGGLMFGIGMTLASGCGNKTLVRIGGGNLKSLAVLVIAAICAYAMLWTPVFEKAFFPWITATTINLQQYDVANQEVGTVLAGMFGLPLSRGFNVALASVVVIGLLAFAFKSADFRGSRDHVLGGAVMGLAIIAGWWITGGSIGQSWKEYAEMSTMIPSRVQTQSYTFISPMGDTVRYLLAPGNLSLINFGVVALAGVIVGSSLYTVIIRQFRVEWFTSWRDLGNHALGGALMGVGGVLSMGCTIGQAITGVSTLAIGSILAFFAIVIGASGTMKYQYWRITQGA